MQRNLCKVEYRDRYYVYVLSKPCGTPFYVGKGKNGRINEHFRPSRLKVNNPKTGMIKKYGDSCLRDIVCYFDKESTAYEYEEWLISHYGCSWDGGILTNYAKNKFDYPTKEQSNRDRAYPTKELHTNTEEQIVTAYTLYYTEGLSSSKVSEQSGINYNYIYYLVNGKKSKDLYDKYVKSELIVNNRREGTIYDPQILDEDIIKVYDMYFKDNLHIKDISERSGIGLHYVRSLVQGHKRKHLFEEYEKTNDTKSRIITRKNKEVMDRLLLVEWMVNKGLSVSAAASMMGVPKTTTYRYIKAQDIDISNRDGNLYKTPKYLTFNNSKILFEDDSIIFTTHINDARAYIVDLTA